jgi:hypothetical protein
MQTLKRLDKLEAQWAQKTQSPRRVVPWFTRKTDTPPEVGPNDILVKVVYDKGQPHE